MTDNDENKNQINVDEVLDKESEATRARFTKEKKKQYLDLNMSWIMLIVVALATFGICYAVLQSPEANLSNWYVVLFAIVAYVISLVVYNLGKILFGYVAGYKLARLELLGFTVIFADKAKVTFSFKYFFELHLNMAPRSEEEEPHPTLMLLGGTILYAIFTALMLGLSFLSISYSMVLCIRYGLALGALLVLYEIFPCKLDTPNDMYYIIVSHGKDNTVTFNRYLRNNLADYAGLDVVTETFDKYDDSRIKPAVLLGNLHNQVYASDYQGALKTIELMTNNELYLQPNMVVEMTYEKFYLYLLHGRTSEAAKELVYATKRQRNAPDFVPSISALRTDVLISGLLDNSLEELTQSEKDFEKGVKNMGMTPRVKKEIEIVKSELRRVKEVHTDWDIKPLEIVAEAK